MAVEAGLEVAVRWVRVVLEVVVEAGEHHQRFGEGLEILSCPVEEVGLVEVSIAVVEKQQEYPVIAGRPQEALSQIRLVI